MYSWAGGSSILPSFSCGHYLHPSCGSEMGTAWLHVAGMTPYPTLALGSLWGAWSVQPGPSLEEAVNLLSGPQGMRPVGPCLTHL